MDTFYQQLINLFTSPPGNLIYHIVLAFAVTAAIQGVLISRRAAQGEFLGRALFGMGFVLAGQVLLFLVSGLAWQGLANPHIFLPPLDRTVTLFSIVWIIWLWAFPRPVRLADGLVGLATVVLLIAFFFTLNQWGMEPPANIFNGSWLDTSWEIATLAVVLLGILVLGLRRPDGWGIGLGFLLVNLAGHIVQFLWPPASGDFSGIVRLAQLCSYPLLPALAQRLVLPAHAFVAQMAASRPAAKFKVAPPVHKGSTELEPGVQRERRRYSADPRAVHAYLDVALAADPARLRAALARAMAQTMLADICFYLNDPGVKGDLVFQVGYDLIREEEIPGVVIPRDKVPSLVSSMQRSKPYRLEAGSSTPDMKALCERFGMQDIGSLMLVPLANDLVNYGAFLFLSPYSDRIWTPEDQSFFAAMVPPLARLLQQPPAKAAPSVDLAAGPVGATLELEALRQQLELARQEAQQLKDGADRLQQQRISTPDVESLLAVQKEAQESIATLQIENDNLRRELVESNGNGRQASSAEIAYIEAEMRQTLQEVAHLQNKLATANMQILTLEKQLSQPVRMINEEREVVASIAQELRQPMASVIGYTDLLMSESVGILGALQRKFLERVRSSIERMRNILDDLVRVISMQDGNIALVAQTVQASAAIDQALSETRAQLQEKNIVLQVDLPDELPELHADRDAIQQILVHLLQNAGAATPVDGTISLKVRIDDQDSAEPYVLFQITDTGGGVAPGDMSRVFSRRYRADNPLIQGIGDTGVGLSIAKTLTEAHGGRIWVESEPDHTTTFSVLLPVRPKAIIHVMEAQG
jgi:signal transduction histidine kinase